ncbi:MAG: hypothetical protein HQ541_13320, partial [Mariniphaga sp.]|nr:hypothetical protein [Mariniphaga sp.]
MPNIRFYCDKSKVNKEGFSPIRANIVLDYRSHWQNIEKVKYRYWNNAKQKVDKNRSSEPDNRHEEINSFLEQYDRKSKDFFNDCRLNNIPITSELIRQFYNGQIPDFNNKISFNQTFSNWLDHTKQNNSYNTYRCRKTVFQFFLNFQNDKNFKITFQNIKMPLFDQLKTYAFAEKGYMNNTFAKRINIF